MVLGCIFEKSLLSGSHLTESDRRPSPYQGVTQSSIGAGRAPDQANTSTYWLPPAPNKFSQTLGFQLDGCLLKRAQLRPEAGGWPGVTADQFTPAGNDHPRPWLALGRWFRTCCGVLVVRQHRPEPLPAVAPPAASEWPARPANSPDSSPGSCQSATPPSSSAYPRAESPSSRYPTPGTPLKPQRRQTLSAKRSPPPGHRPG